MVQAGLQYVNLVENHILVMVMVRRVRCRETGPGRIPFEPGGRNQLVNARRLAR